MKRVFSAFLCALLVPVCLCACSGGKTRYNAVYTDVFDTVTEFTAYCDSQEEFDKAANAMHEELLRLHKLFDIYNGYEDVENVFTMNVRTYTSLEPTAPEIVALVELGREYYELSGGKLNIALGSVLSIWHEYREKGTGIPSTEELQAAAEHTDINRVGVAGGFVYCNDIKLKLDFGAIAKGYASGLAAQVVKDCGVTDFALNIGGNVVTSGEKPEGKWVIGVQDPDGGIYTKVKVSDISVVTSGDYQRYYEYEGVRYHHIIDTETLFPANLYRSVTVICKDPAQADALSTALFCMPLEQGKELAKSRGAEVLWILPDKSAVRTDGFAEYE